MKSIVIVLALLMTLTLILFTGCSRVEPGYVAIKVNQAGSNKGVEDYPMLTGYVFYNPFTTSLYDYPVFQQSVIWCASPTEGSPNDESISFNCKGGAGITADVSISGKFVVDKIPYIFVKFRSDPENIINTYVHNEVRDALGRVGSTYDAMDILGDKRGEFLDAVIKDVNAHIGDWWTIDYITFPNRLRPDPRIEESINAIIVQKQQTQQAELKVQQSKAEAEQAVAVAEGQRQVKIANAEGEAQSILVKAKAQADANELIAKSLAANPLVLQSIALDKWNGVLPTVTGDTLPFINIGPITTK